MSTERNRKKALKRKLKRHERLATADTDGWMERTPYHFQKHIEGILCNWYPSKNKVVIDNVSHHMPDIREIGGALKKAKKLRLDAIPVTCRDCLFVHHRGQPCPNCTDHRKEYQRG